MSETLLLVRLTLVTLLAMPGLVLAQASQQSGKLVVSGQSGQAPVLQLNGKSYVDIEGLARLLNGSLRFDGNEITLTLPGPAAGTSTIASPSPGTNSAFSQEFVKAGIEEMTVIREWRSALVSAVQNGFPLTDDIVAGFRGQALANLRLTESAASTDSDRNAYHLISNVFDNMQKLSNKVLAARKNMSYISPDTLKNDALFQKILNCTRSLASMAASGQFQDDGSCR